MKAVLILVLTFSFGSVFAQVKTNDLQVTYIANEGFMLITKHHKILIDALFSDGYGFFSTPSEKTLNEMMDAKAPFDSVSLCFLTHYHKDHSDSRVMSEYLSRYPSVKLITTRPSLVFIDGEQFRFVKLKKQFCEITPEANKSIAQTVDGVSVKVLGLKHLSYYEDGIDIEEYMTNVGFYISLDGIKIFHSGDTNMENFREYVDSNGQWEDQVDVAFVYYEMLNEGRSDLDYLIKTLSPQYLVLMHVPPGFNEKWSEKVEQLKPAFPNIVLFRNSLESKTWRFIN